jgi:hypothetical protein
MQVNKWTNGQTCKRVSAGLIWNIASVFQRFSVSVFQRLSVCILLTACSTPPPAQPSPIAVLPPSPTIAVAVIPTAGAAPAPAPAPVTRPTATAQPVAPLATANPAVFSYLWPAYLPQGMQPAPKESRVASDAELGTNAPGFFLLTFNGNGGTTKIIVGGGAVEPFAVTGETREVELDGRKAKLNTNGDQRLITFDTITGQGSLFMLGVGIGEAELLQSAESLLPIELADMRARIGL